MIGVAVTLLGAVSGGVTAGRPNGKRKHIAQYDAVYALIFTLHYMFGSNIILHTLL